MLISTTTRVHAEYAPAWADHQSSSRVEPVKIIEIKQAYSLIVGSRITEISREFGGTLQSTKPSKKPANYNINNINVISQAVAKCSYKRINLSADKPSKKKR